MITKEQWVDWKNHPVTQQYVRDLMGNRLERMEEIAEGKAVGDQLLIEIGFTQGVKDSVEYAIRNFNFVEIDNGPEGRSVSSDSES